jgi:hypothetical protein
VRSAAEKAASKAKAAAKPQKPSPHRIALGVPRAVGTNPESRCLSHPNCRASLLCLMPC